MPAGFEWCSVDVKDDLQIQEVYDLLKNNFVEDSDSNYRFEYSVDLLRWVLDTPNRDQDLHLGVKATGKTKILGFLAGIPTKININGNVIKTCYINFLVVHKKLRHKKLTTLLVKEIARRIKSTNTWSAIYTAGHVIRPPFAQSQFFHRQLNVKKNIEIGYAALPKNTTLARYVKSLALKEISPSDIKGIPRVMTTKDVAEVYQLYKRQMKKYKCHFVYSQDEFMHLIVPKKGVVYTLVIEGADGKLTDFISFYNLPSQIIKDETGHGHKYINVSYFVKLINFGFRLPICITTAFQNTTNSSTWLVLP